MLSVPPVSFFSHLLSSLFMTVNGGDASAEEPQNCLYVVLGGVAVERRGRRRRNETLPFFDDFFLVNKQTFQGRWGRGKVIFVFVVVLFSLFLKESACFECFVFGAACLFCLCVFVLERTRRDEVREREKSRGRASEHGILVSLAFSSTSLSLCPFSIHPSIPPRAPFLSFLPAQEKREKDINKQEG